MIAVRAVIERLLNDVWYENSPLSWLLIPLHGPSVGSSTRDAPARLTNGALRTASP